MLQLWLFIMTHLTQQIAKRSCIRVAFVSCFDINRAALITAFYPNQRLHPTMSHKACNQGLVCWPGQALTQWLYTSLRSASCHFSGVSDLQPPPRPPSSAAAFGVSASESFCYFLSVCVPPIPNPRLHFSEVEAFWQPPFSSSHQLSRHLRNDARVRPSVYHSHPLPVRRHRACRLHLPERVTIFKLIFFSFLKITSQI